MSNIVVGFDIHAWLHKRHGGPRKNGVNRRGELCLGTTHRLLDFANEHDAHLVVAGDLVDDPGPVQPQFAARLRAELARCQGGVSLMLGNHDMTTDGDHSLGIYEVHNDYSDVTVCAQTSWSHGRSSHDEPWGYDEACLVPFHRGIHDERVRDVPLLIGHFGVFDDSFPPWAQRSKGAWHVDRLFEFMKERNIKCLLAGDWHSRRIWGRRIENLIAPTLCYLPTESLDPNELPMQAFTLGGTQVVMQGGALNPTGFDNPGLRGYGTAALWDGERLSWQELPGPRFCVVRSDTEEKSVVDEAQRLGHNLFLRRYYEGKDKPQAPEGVEAYEALPVKVERAASVCLEQVKLPQDRMQQLVSDWLESAGDDREALGALIKEYV